MNFKLWLIFLFLLSTQLIVSKYTLAQGNYYLPDARLYESIDRSYIEQISVEKPELIIYYNFYLENSYYVVSLNKDKPVTGTNIHTVARKDNKGEYFQEISYDKSTFNPLKYDFQREYDNFSIYIWEETGIAIVFYPVKHFEIYYKKHLKQTLK